MKEKLPVWKQIKEDQEDYQYFKRFDRANLNKTLESAKHNQVLTLR